MTDELGEDLGVTRERVRQVQLDALANLRKILARRFPRSVPRPNAAQACFRLD